MIRYAIDDTDLAKTAVPTATIAIRGFASICQGVKNGLISADVDPFSTSGKNDIESSVTFRGGRSAKEFES